jgi:prepilin-type N-terminal cleavage/methylation domain-containing protein
MKNSYTRRGFTIIEVVVAVFLVAAGIAMATSLLVRSTQVAEHSRAVTAASLIARSHMDRLCQASFAELISDRFQRNGKEKQAGVSFNWSADLEDIENQPDLIRIRMIVSWESIQGHKERAFSCIRRR